MEAKHSGSNGEDVVLMNKIFNLQISYVECDLFSDNSSRCVPREETSVHGERTDRFLETDQTRREDH